MRARRLIRKRVLPAAAVAGWMAAIALAVLTLLLSGDVRKARRPFAAEINPPAGVDFANAYFGPGAISPDGRTLAFIAGDSRASKLWIRDMATGRAEALEGTELVAQSFDVSELKLTGSPIPVAENLDYWNPREAASAGLKPQPGAAAPYLARGILFVQLADYDHAEADFDKAKELDPHLTVSEAARGMAALSSGPP
jgi:tetratricopeptide (TPR) repeat protein